MDHEEKDFIEWAQDDRETYTWPKATASIFGILGLVAICGICMWAFVTTLSVR